MVVRELLIMLGAKIDPKTLKQADQQIRGFAKTTQNVLKTLLGLGFIKAFKDVAVGVTSAASAVIENQNVMDAAFGEGEARVKQWSKTFGDAAGRSRYELEAMAGSMGGMLLPMLDKNQERTREMSVGLAGLAVDLASFHNLASDTEALQKLRAGISGESEPLKILGVNLTQEALQEYARSQGINKSIKSMSIAEKAELRYGAIMKQTEHVQGDAIKTADQLANSARGLASKWKEVAVTAGTKLIPMMSTLVRYGKRLVTWLAEIAEETNIVQSAFIVLGGVAAYIAWSIAAPFLPLIAAIAAVIVIFDDLLTFFKGGDSVIGRFIDWVAGPGSAAEALKTLKQVFWDFVEWAKTDGIQIFRRVKDAVFGFVRAAAPYIKEFFVTFGRLSVWLWDNVLIPFFGWLTNTAIPAVSGFVEKVGPPLKELFGSLGEIILWMWENAWKPFWGFVGGVVIDTIVTLASAIADTLGPAITTMIDFFGDVYDAVVAVVDRIGDFVGGITDAAKAAGKFFGFDFSEEPKGAAKVGMGIKYGGGVVAAHAGNVPRLAPMSQTSNSNRTDIYQTVQNNFTGNMTRHDASEIARRTEGSVSKANKATMAALKQKKVS